MEEARENRASRDGFGGIGVRIRMVERGVKILSVMENTPAEDAGLKSEDIIVHIEAEPAAGLSQREVVRRLRGPIRTEVRLTVERGTQRENLRFTVTRTHIVPQTVNFRREGDFGYFRVSSFNQDTARTLRQKILSAKEQMRGALKGWIIDLRNNPGGLLDQAVAVSDLFVEGGRIVSTHGRHPDSHQYFDAESVAPVGVLPVVVLINGNSASASEIVAAALQDSGRAVVIGSSSFGKGTVQTVLRLPNEGELTLTWARFHAPSGYGLHRRGVMPDICTTTGSVSKASDVVARLRRGLLPIMHALRNKNVHPDDEKAIMRLRASCPTREGEDEIDLEVARDLLSDPVLYARAIAGNPDSAGRERPHVHVSASTKADCGAENPDQETPGSC